MRFLTLKTQFNEFFSYGILNYKSNFEELNNSCLTLYIEGFLKLCLCLNDFLQEWTSSRSSTTTFLPLISCSAPKIHGRKTKPSSCLFLLFCFEKRFFNSKKLRYSLIRQFFINYLKELLTVINIVVLKKLNSEKINTTEFLIHVVSYSTFASITVR